MDNKERYNRILNAILATVEERDLQHKFLSSALGSHRTRASRLKHKDPGTIDNLSFQDVANLWNAVRSQASEQAKQEVSVQVAKVFCLELKDGK